MYKKNILMDLEGRIFLVSNRKMLLEMQLKKPVLNYILLSMGNSSDF
tara:strand:- start:163 stop:303 length:141 start_codon:yes stop_codon:yes gene_type:complete